MKKFAVTVLVVLGLWHVLDKLPTPTQLELAPDTPDQLLFGENSVASWTCQGMKIVPLAAYSLQARVLHRSDYYLDHMATLAPFDLALGWGRMSDPAVYDKLSIGQGWRWYTWYCSGEPPIPADEISSSSANTHIIPATPEIKSKLYWVRAGDVVKLSGYLVEVDGADGSTWRSSLSRTDTGSGACEIMWVTDAAKIGR